MEKQKLLARLRRAVQDFNMIEPNDKVAVGVSGGKDSLALLSLLATYQTFSDVKFDLCAVTIDLGFSDDDIFAPVRDFCASLGVEYRIEKTDIAKIVFDARKEPNPCSLCAKMRRGALNNTLIDMHANKLALGHHADDVVDTFLLSMMFEGRLSTFAPKAFMDRKGVALIRPLIYCYERDLSAFAKTLPVVKSPCPVDKKTKREDMKQLVNEIRKTYPDVTEKIFNAIARPQSYNLWNDVEEIYQNEKNGKH